MLVQHNLLPKGVDGWIPLCFQVLGWAWFLYPKAMFYKKWGKSGARQDVNIVILVWVCWAGARVLKKFGVLSLQALEKIASYLQSDRFFKMPVNNKMAKWGNKCIC